MIRQLALVGTGLIGGSLALALRKSGYCESVMGYARTEKSLQYALENGVIDQYSTVLEEVVAAADVIVIALPLGAMDDCLRGINVSARSDAIITDVGSAKGSVMDAAYRIMPERLAFFVPGHPIAGKEQSGVQYAEAELFVDHFSILTPLKETSSHALSIVTEMWQQARAKVVTMDVAHHDRVLAATSHLPHMLAYLLVDTLSKMEDKGDIFQYAAGGFYDFTRIASSSPEMWRDICLSNREAILEMLRCYRLGIDELMNVIEVKDALSMQQLFSHAKQRRDALVKDKNQK